MFRRGSCFAFGLFLGALALFRASRADRGDALADWHLEPLARRLVVVEPGNGNAG
jgi:hypothetical protein